jgi:serine/threonine-protein kinase
VIENDFINKAFIKGMINFEQVKQCIKLQEKMVESGSSVPIWEVLVLKGFLTQEQVEALRDGKEGPKTYPFGNYTLYKKLGEGGMGVVYLGKRNADGVEVAVKLLPVKFSESTNAVKRFEREAKASIALSHRNIVKGHEFGQFKGRWFYVMEFIRGKTVGAMITEKVALEEKQALQITIQVAYAMEAIFKAGIVHRDIKPDNIIIDDKGVARLMDLGLAKSVDGTQTTVTQSGLAVGTPHYMPPEQIIGKKDVDVRSDIYSLGATLYHMLTGVQPFKGTTWMEIMNRQLINELESPKKIRPGLSDGVCQIIEKCMAGREDDRYQNPTELVQDLCLVMDGKNPQGVLMDAGLSIVKHFTKS